MKRPQVTASGYDISQCGSLEPVAGVEIQGLHFIYHRPYIALEFVCCQPVLSQETHVPGFEQNKSYSGIQADKGFDHPFTYDSMGSILDGLDITILLKTSEDL